MFNFYLFSMNGQCIWVLYSFSSQLEKEDSTSKRDFPIWVSLPEGFSTRVFCSSTTEGADKLASGASSSESRVPRKFKVGNLIDVDAWMENNGTNNMFKERNDQNGETQKEANTSSENKVDIDQLVIDIKNSSEGSDLKSDSLTKPCIYKVPGHLRKVNAKAYTPTLISIGPLLHHYLRFKTMEKLKLRYVKRFRNREESEEPDLLKKLLITIDEKKEDIRSCYGDSFSFEDDYFVKIILVDAIFILELFLSCFLKTDKLDESNQENHDSTDPIKVEPWMLSVLTLDLVLLENQLPFFVIKDIYNNVFSTKPETPPLIQLIFEFFKDFNVQNMKPEGFNVEIKHFTNLLRIFYLHAPPTSSKSKRCNCFN